MKRIDQTIFGEPHGNCLQACIASIFDLELDDVPNFMEHPEDRWQDALQDFLTAFDLEFCDLLIEQTKNVWTPIGFHLITGDGHRGLIHCVVGLNGRMIHDPHPERKGLLKEEFWTIFVARLMSDEGRHEHPPTSPR